MNDRGLIPGSSMYISSPLPNWFLPHSTSYPVGTCGNVSAAWCWPLISKPRPQWKLCLYLNIVTCIRDVAIRRVLHWMMGFVDCYITHLAVTNNTALSLIYTLYSSPLHTHYCSQSSLVVFWQRIYNSFVDTAAQIRSSFHSIIPFLPSSSIAISRNSV
jgi:hypothetical protein